VYIDVLGQKSNELSSGIESIFEKKQIGGKNEKDDGCITFGSG